MQDKQTVSYVDDNPKARRLLTTVFKQSGFTVLTAADAMEALKRSSEAQFDLALLDYQKPQISGSQLAREIKFIHPDVPIVMISGRAFVSDEELNFVDAHFGSGTALDDLIATMHMLLSRPFVNQRKLAVPTHWSDST
jgi:CheY-like chemotaxis protein